METRLCYVYQNWAYFTSASLDQQWGDDWDDAPYEHNAETPYDHISTKLANGKWSSEPVTITKVAWDGPFNTPADLAHMDSHFSVEDINRRKLTPWLSPEDWIEGAEAIPAGVSLKEFTRRIEAAKGRVYTALSAPAGPLTAKELHGIADRIGAHRCIPVAVTAQHVRVLAELIANAPAWTGPQPVADGQITEQENH